MTKLPKKRFLRSHFFFFDDLLLIIGCDLKLANSKVSFLSLARRRKDVNGDMIAIFEECKKTVFIKSRSYGAVGSRWNVLGALHLRRKVPGTETPAELRGSRTRG